MRLHAKSFVGAFLAVGLLSLLCLATAMVSIQGRVSRIVDGIVDIQTNSGISQLLLQKLPKESQAAVRKASADHTEIHLEVTLDMVKPK